MKLSALAICLLAMSIVIPFVPEKSAAEGRLEVYRLMPHPNYPLCTGKRDLLDLTDGVLSHYPMWVHSECVGWTDQGPVKIFIKVKNCLKKVSGVLSIHTAKGSFAGVKIPLRVDVYGDLGNGKYHHAGDLEIEEQAFQDRESHWLNVSVDSVSPRMMVIVRPSGRYLFIDELRWKNISNSRPRDLEVIGDAHACELDSVKRHRHSLLGKIRPEKEVVKSWVGAFGKFGIATWVVENPFDSFPAFPPVENIHRCGNKIELWGSKSELECGCIGMLTNGKDKRKIEVAVEGYADIVNSISLSRVQGILSAEGQLVFDPLIPLVSGDQIDIPGRCAVYIWVQVDFHNIPPGHHGVAIKLRENAKAWNVIVPVSINVAPVKLKTKHRPAATNWAYTSDRPIWRNRKLILKDLIKHGINVFVVHPSAIPMPSIKDDWDNRAAQRFVKDLSLFQGKGLILLYLEWGRGRGPAWLDPLYGKDLERQKVAVQRWVRRIRQVLESLGISHSEWALYPIDEPCGENLHFLREIAAWVKEEDPAIQLYANPITSSSAHTSPEDLISLKGLVDFWQPSLRFATNDGAPFFAGLKHLWWVYVGIPRPAKSASPWYYYRLMAWRAWEAGASGVGFWSYSDTSGTSAWDDLDGRRPDYAVVYEGRDSSETPISSRRWEAFREGVEDFQLLETVAKGDIPSSSKMDGILKARVKNLLEKQEVSFDILNGLRKEMLQGLPDKLLAPVALPLSN
ncbi:MAG: hypothetical protein JRJ35_07355 [Deltaproteobacteria bacterium]|nr:hypothetical protein [Deltaproteobacteria bacterium]MBW1932244.1 hypothetical protein [Deltaproteobacteria bacterium]